MGGKAASWLMLSTVDQEVWVQALTDNILLCSWVRQFILTVPLSIQVYKWLMLEGNPAMDRHLIQGGGKEWKNSSHLMLHKLSEASAWWATWIYVEFTFSVQFSVCFFLSEPFTQRGLGSFSHTKAVISFWLAWTMGKYTVVQFSHYSVSLHGKITQLWIMNL